MNSSLVIALAYSNYCQSTPRWLNSENAIKRDDTISRSLWLSRFTTSAFRRFYVSRRLKRETSRNWDETVGRFSPNVYHPRRCHNLWKRNFSRRDTATKILLSFTMFPVARYECFVLIIAATFWVLGPGNRTLLRFMYSTSNAELMFNYEEVNYLLS